MIPVLTIGARHFAFKKTEDAARVLTLLAAAQETTTTYHYKKSQLYFHTLPLGHSSGTSSVSLEMIAPNRFVEPFSENPQQQPDDIQPLCGLRRLPAKSMPRQLNPGGAA